ncbi:MAG: putative molybdenum carrier protein [Alphaproteobacteria bacterium]|nr:putative molybdenum carrier protein [Alphaproteobacteria bacterium]
MRDIKIVSGAQTGVDRGALDAALALGVPCGGWCPQGRMAMDGEIPERYPVVVLEGSGYRKRTRQNVIDSDATVIIFFGKIIPKGGTEQTVQECVKAGKPHLLIDGDSLEVDAAAAMLATFCDEHSVGVLNVAGPSGEGLPRAHIYTQNVIERFLQST